MSALSADVDLKGGVIAAQTGTIQAGYVAESGATLLEFATPDETVAAVRNGEADAVFADKDYLAPQVKESGGALAFAGEEVQLGGGVGMGLRASRHRAEGQVRRGHRSMKADGTLNALITKWFGAEAARRSDP
jgi:polar amino acid transport system substrate-binding protein